jgi:hypothetical protein
MSHRSSWTFLGLTIRALEIVWLAPWIGLIGFFLVALAWIYLTGGY